MGLILDPCKQISSRHFMSISIAKYFYDYRYVSCVMGCPYEGHIAPEAVAKVTVFIFI